MEYITKSNASRMISENKLTSIDMEGELYKIDIDFFNKFETNLLLATKLLFESPDDFFAHVYARCEARVDTFSWIYEGGQPSFHSIPTCERLLSDYKNIKIPLQVKNMGPAEVARYRVWFKEREAIFENNPQQFVEFLAVSWGVRITASELKNLRRESGNTGPTEVENVDLGTLERKIDNLIRDSHRFILESEKNRRILSKYAKHAYLGKKKTPLSSNYTGYSDEEVWDLLCIFETKYKQELMRCLTHYYRLKFNPELKLEEDLLTQLGFAPCHSCHADNF